MVFETVGKIGLMVGKSLSKGKFWACRHAPELLQIAGTAGVVGTAALACKGTKEIMEKEEPEIKDYAKAYAPTAVCGISTIGCFTGGHYILKKRNIALACAYKVIDDSYKNYRSNVIEKYGEEEDFRLKNSVHTEKMTVTEVGEDGKKHKKKVDVDILDDEPNAYTFIYDDKHSMKSVIDSVTARNDLVIAENNANRILLGRGYITLNEVLRGLGLHETSVGQIVGWQTKGNGDGYVKFNVKQIRTAMDPEGVAFAVEFNVDGPIYQDIDKYTRMWGEQ